MRQPAPPANHAPTDRGILTLLLYVIGLCAAGAGLLIGLPR